MSSFQPKKIDISPENVEKFITKFGEASIQRKANELIALESEGNIIRLNDKNWTTIKKTADALNESPSWVINEMLAKIEIVCENITEKTNIVITKSPMHLKVRNKNNPITNY